MMPAGPALRVLFVVLIPVGLALGALAARNRTVAGRIRSRSSIRLSLVVLGTRGDFTARGWRYRNLTVAALALAAFSGMASLLLGGWEERP